MFLSHRCLPARILVVMLSLQLAHTAIAEGTEPNPSGGSDVSAEGSNGWNRFRGPNGSGFIENVRIPDSWTEEDYAWIAEVPGIGHSSPVVWGSRIYLQSADRNHANQYLICLSRDDGRELWRKEFPGGTYQMHARNSFATATPGVDDQHVYFAWSTGKDTILLALTHDGEKVWERNLGRYVSAHGFASSPVPIGDLVVLSNQQNDIPDAEVEDGSIGDSFMAAYRCSDGEVVWQVERHCGKACYSVPAVYHAPDGTTQLVCCNTNDGMYGLNLEDGKELWSIRVFDKRTVSSPLVVGDLIFGSTGSGGGGNYLVAVDISGPPREAYRVTNSAPYVPTSVAKGDLVFLWSDAGIVTCLEAKTGKEVWRKRVGGNVSSSPIRVGDQLVGISDVGDVTVLAASRTYKVLGESSLGGPTRATPAVTPEAVYFRTESKVLCLPTIEDN